MYWARGPRLMLASVILAGCAGAGTSSAPVVAADCDELRARVALTDDERRAALDRQQDAWKAVLPFLVAGRYMKGKAEAAQADQRQADLQRELDARGCAASAGSIS